MMNVLKAAVAGALLSATLACGDDEAEVMAPDTRVSYTLAFEEDYVNLDTEGVVTCEVFEQFCEEGLDLKVAFNADRTVHAVVFQNQSEGVEIAHLRDTAFDEVTENEVAGAEFTTSLIDEPFDATRVILIRTDLGSVYKLGNATEDNQAITFDADLL